MNTGESNTEQCGTKESPNSSVPIPLSGIGAFAIRHRLAIIFITVAVCFGGIYCALRMPSSVFPETELSLFAAIDLVRRLAGLPCPVKTYR